MTVLIGHPTGTPFAFNAALSHAEGGRLGGLCIPWMPSETVLRLASVGPLRPMAERLRRRNFPPLAGQPLVQGRAKEWQRLFLRAIGRGSERLVLEANEWVMSTMARVCRRPEITAVHAYEDCALGTFVEAKRLGKACIYDLPIGYYPAWRVMQAELAQQYADWLPPDGLAAPFNADAKRQELTIADAVVAPSEFVAETVRRFHPDAPVSVVRYAADLPDAHPRPPRGECLTFLFAGQCTIRKGVPLLIEAWRAAAIPDARLQLVGSWGLAETKKALLPPSCEWLGPVSFERTQQLMREADVLAFPTNFEGYGLVVCEAMAAGMAVLTTRGRGSDEGTGIDCACTVPANDLDALVEAIRWFAANRDKIPAMGEAARWRAAAWTWRDYRARLGDITASLV